MNLLIADRFSDNGELSHHELINSETGECLWSSFPEETVARGQKIVSPAPLSSIGKTDEEILQPLWDAFAAKHPESLRTLKEVQDEFPESIEPILKAMRLARLSALSEGKTETKEEISDDLRGCRLNEKDLKHIYACYKSSGAIAMGVEEKVLQKVSAYLGKTAKELPTEFLQQNSMLKKYLGRITDYFKDEINSVEKIADKQMDYGTAEAIHKLAFYKIENIGDWFSSRASEALRQEREKNKIQLEDFARFILGNTTQSYSEDDEIIHTFSKNCDTFYLEESKNGYSYVPMSASQITEKYLTTSQSAAPPLGEKGKE